MSSTTESKNFTQRVIYETLKQPFTIDSYSTLNEKFNVGTILPPNTGYPDVKYFTIGRGGHTTVVGANQSVSITFNQHRATDSALFEHIPFIMIPTTIGGNPNNLSLADQAKYRMRKIETYNNVDYYVYYIKVLEPIAFSLTNSTIYLTDGNIVSNTPYVPTINDLSPTPYNDSNTVINITTGQHFLVQGLFSITLSIAEINKIIEACIIKYGDASYATISELGIVSGFEDVVTPSYTEIQTAQIQVFFNLLEILQQDSSILNMDFGITKSIPYPPIV